MEIYVAVISLFGTSIGTFGGILMSNKLTNYRIMKLEEKVDKHNKLVERMYKIEYKVCNLEKVNKHE